MSTRQRILGNASKYPRNEAQEILQFIFVSELLQPGASFWLVSPWISDISIIREGDFLFPDTLGDMPRSEIRLTEALIGMANAGTQVRIVTKTGESKNFDDALQREKTGVRCLHPQNIEVQWESDLHAKGIVGDEYSLTGSMNYTYYGININDELLTFSTIPADVGDLRARFEKDYGAVHG